MRGERVRDASEESTADGSASALAADNQPGVYLPGDVVDRLRHRLVGLLGSCAGVVAARASSGGALVSELSRPSRFFRVDLAFIWNGDEERAGAGQLYHRRRPHR